MRCHINPNLFDIVKYFAIYIISIKLIQDHYFEAKKGIN